MQTTTIEIAYVNPPKEGRKTGSVKTKEGQYYDVWPNMLAQFKEGCTYTVEYTERDFKGTMYRTVQKILPATPGTATKAPATNGGYYQPRPTAPQDAERMFVCALLVAFIRAGKIEGGGQLVPSINLIREAWKKTLGNPQQADDMNDEIPFA